MLVKLVPTFADRGCHMVSVTNPCGRNLGFLDQIVCNNRPITTLSNIKFLGIYINDSMNWSRQVEYISRN
jgi:hypothetical protein